MPLDSAELVSHQHRPSAGGMKNPTAVDCRGVWFNELYLIQLINQLNLLYPTKPAPSMTRTSRAIPYLFSVDTTAGGGGGGGGITSLTKVQVTAWPAGTEMFDI